MRTTPAHHATSPATQAAAASRSEPTRKVRPPHRLDQRRQAVEMGLVDRGWVQEEIGHHRHQGVGRGQRFELRTGTGHHLRSDQGRRPAARHRRASEHLLDPEAVFVTTGSQGGNRPGGRARGSSPPWSPSRRSRRGTPTPRSRPTTRSGTRVIGEEVEAGPDQGHRQCRLAASARPRHQHALAVEGESGGVQRVALESLHGLHQGQRQQRMGGQDRIASSVPTIDISMRPLPGVHSILARSW